MHGESKNSEIFKALTEKTGSNQEKTTNDVEKVPECSEPIIQKALENNDNPIQTTTSEAKVSNATDDIEIDDINLKLLLFKLFESEGSESRALLKIILKRMYGGEMGVDHEELLGYIDVLEGRIEFLEKDIYDLKDQIHSMTMDIHSMTMDSITNTNDLSDALESNWEEINDLSNRIQSFEEKQGGQ